MNCVVDPKFWDCDNCNCDENGIGQKWQIPGAVEWSRLCGRRMITDFTWYLLDLHDHYERGHLAVAGGACDQPGVYLQAMQIISEWKSYGKTSNS